MLYHQVALWIDNYQHARWSLDPPRVDVTLDCTTIAIVTINKPPRSPTYRGHRALRTMLSKLGSTATKVVVRLQRLREFIGTLSESSIDCTMIRVPLDVMWSDATTRRWQPLVL